MLGQVFVCLFLGDCIYVFVCCNDMGYQVIVQYIVVFVLDLMNKVYNIGNKYE